jgi:hypothetical protein
MRRPRRNPYSIMLAAVIGVMVGLMVPSEGVGEEIPSIIKDGFEAYKTGGPDAAVKKWLEGSPVSGSQEAALVPGQFKTIETVYGPYKGYEVIRIVTITPSTNMVFLVIRFDRGPCYGSFTVYNREEQDSIITHFNFNTKPEMVIPAAILWGSK